MSPLAERASFSCVGAYLVIAEKLTIRPLLSCEVQKCEGSTWNFVLIINLK